MNVNLVAVRAVCCKAWGVTPAEYESMRQRGEVTFQAVIAQCRLEMLASPLASEAFWEWLMPGGRAAERKQQHNKTNLDTIAILKRMKDKQNGR